MEYFGKQDNRLLGSRLWCMRFLFRFQGLVCEMSFVVVFLCWSLLNPDLFLSSLFGGMCYFNTSVSSLGQH